MRLPKGELTRSKADIYTYGRRKSSSDVERMPDSMRLSPRVSRLDWFADRVGISWAEAEPYIDKLQLVDKEILSMAIDDGMRQDMIGRFVGLTQSAVAMRLDRIIKRILYMITAVNRPYNNDPIVKLTDEGYNQTEIAKRLGVCQATVSYRLSKYPLTRRVRSLARNYDVPWSINRGPDRTHLRAGIPYV